MTGDPKMAKQTLSSTILNRTLRDLYYGISVGVTALAFTGMPVYVALAISSQVINGVLLSRGKRFNNPMVKGSAYSSFISPVLLLGCLAAIENPVTALLIFYLSKFSLSKAISFYYANQPDMLLNYLYISSANFAVSITSILALTTGSFAFTLAAGVAIATSLGVNYMLSESMSEEFYIESQIRWLTNASLLIALLNFITIADPISAIATFSFAGIILGGLVTSFYETVSSVVATPQAKPV